MLRLILSAHDFSDRPDRPNVSALCRAIDDLPPHSVAKIAYHADHMVDTFDALDLMHRYGERMMAVAMGEEGLWTRVLVGKLGGFGTYCALDADAATAPGQPLLRQMIDLIRWPSIDKDTKVYGVVGDPVAHSVGPLLHNRWFAEAGLNAVYLPLRVRRCVDPQGGTNGRDNGNGRGSGGPRRSDLGRFLEACRKRPWLDVSGLSVTTPHKQAALEWVGYGANAMARSIGAVNTLCFSGEGAQGYNTDADAALDSLIDALGCSRGDLSGLSVDVLGSGGAARALVHGLAEFGCRITIYGRSAPSIERLAGDYGATGRGWNERTRRDGRVLVNCTSVGMWPDAGASPLPPGSSFSDCDLVFDLIYNPLETRLLRDAKAAGVKTLNGLDTFIRQAAAQFELWTGRPPDTAGSYEAVTQALSRTTETGHGPD